MKKRKLEYVGILDADGELVLVRSQGQTMNQKLGLQIVRLIEIALFLCNSQADADSYDGPVLRPDLESAQNQEDDYGTLCEGDRFVKVTLTVEDIAPEVASEQN